MTGLLVIALILIVQVMCDARPPVEQTCSARSMLDSEHIPGCASEIFNSTTKEWQCNKCQDGYCPSIDNTECDEGPEGCLECDPAGECSSCFDGYYLKDRACFKCEASCLKCLNGCECLHCKDERLFPEGCFCVPCGDACKKCLQARDGFDCLVCEDGYVRTRKPGPPSARDRYYCQQRLLAVVDNRLLAVILAMIGLSVAVIVCWCYMGCKQLFYKPMNDGNLLLAEVNDERE